MEARGGVIVGARRRGDPSRPSSRPWDCCCLGGPAAAGAAETASPPTVRILAAGVDPPTVQVAPGDAVIWINESGGDRSIVATDASFDSGHARGRRPLPVRVHRGPHRHLHGEPRCGRDRDRGRGAGRHPGRRRRPPRPPARPPTWRTRGRAARSPGSAGARARFRRVAPARGRAGSARSRSRASGASRRATTCCRRAGTGANGGSGPAVHDPASERPLSGRSGLHTPCPLRPALRLPGRSAGPWSSRPSRHGRSGAARVWGRRGGRARRVPPGRDPGARRRAAVRARAGTWAGRPRPRPRRLDEHDELVHADGGARGRRLPGDRVRQPRGR